MTAGAIPYEGLGGADLVLDATYLAGAQKTSTGGSHVANEPIHHLLPVKNRGGIRPHRSVGDIGIPFVVLTLTGEQVDWPDEFDPTTGVLTYFGDNRTPGKGLLDTPGNRVLDRAFQDLQAGNHSQIPVFFVFERATSRGDYRFLGVAAPGSANVSSVDALVPRWHLHPRGRFQNYEAVFTVLDVETVPRAWIDELTHGSRTGPACPEAWKAFAARGKHSPLISTPVANRAPSKAAQLPSTDEGMNVLRCIHMHFGDDWFAFERFAGEIFRLHRPGFVGDINYTRPYRDGGRDAVGTLIAGVCDKTVIGEFALEAKCYDPDGKAVGVKEVSRLSGRLRARMFGVLVTTSHIGDTAYQEVRFEDRHPVVFLTGVDIVKILRRQQLAHVTSVKAYLEREFPL